jgi:hypothetical protein
MLHTEDNKGREAEFGEFGLLEGDPAEIHLDTDLLSDPDEDEAERSSFDSDDLFEAARTPARTEISFDAPEELAEPEAIDAPEETPEAAPATQAPAAPQTQEIRTGFSWTAFAGCLAALGWLAAAIGVPLSFFGVEALSQLHPAMQAALVALAFGPTILIWLGAAAVGEAAKAGKLAYALTKLAREAMQPDADAAAHTLTHAVRNEIEQLNEAIDGARARLEALEGGAARQALLLEQTISTACSGADALLENLSREREAFFDLNEELKCQSETLAHTVGRQVRLMREASKLVKTELSETEESLETHLASFSEAAASVGERTRALNEAAENAAAASGRLDESLGSALDTLAEATKLTDAARHSTETAVLTANSTANAVRDTTQRAIGDAKRVAELIRTETSAMQDAAAATLATLREAADAARMASDEAQAAADKHAASIEKRLAALASTAKVARKREPAKEQVVEAPQTLHEAAARMAASGGGRSVRVGKGGLSSWNGIMSGKPANDAAPRAQELPARSSDSLLVERVHELIADSGVLLAETLTARDLESVAVASRQGAQARRRAVLDAAPIATTRIARHIRRDAEAKELAQSFRARPDLAKSDHGNGEIIRAYLLVDAALA